MRSFIRFSFALIGVCAAFTTSQAFWWKHKECKPVALAAAPQCESASCAPAVRYVAETHNVESIQYRQVVTTVPVKVMTPVTVMRAVPVPPPVAAPMAAPMGCHGAVAAPAGCHGGAAAPMGCHGAGVPTGCTGGFRGPAGGCNGSGSGVFYNTNAAGEDLSPNLAKLEKRISTIETKIDALTEAVNEMREAGAKTHDKSALPGLPAIPPLPSKTPLGNAAPADADPVLAAARAYKARQATAAAPLPTGTDAGVTRK
jgi:hypothetical protein